MEKMPNHKAETAMLIRKPAAEVFNAFIDPAVTTKFWFTKSSGKLEAGKKIKWTWEMYNHTIALTVVSIVPNEKIIIRWGNKQQETTVEWDFKMMDEDKTFVSVINYGFKGSTDEIIAQIKDSTGGFTWVLAGLKAWLEHGIELNLIADRFPKELGKH